MSTQEKSNGLIITIVSALAVLVPVALIVLLALATREPATSDDFSDDAIAMRIAPVASYNVAPPVVAVKKGPLNGKQVYEETCSSCHGAGLAGAPKLGDKSAWSSRIAAGFNTLYKHALDGFNGMPARGGNADLEDIEVKRAVIFMANQSGANFKE